MKHAVIQDPRSLADALGDIRAEIHALRAREATLREALIEARPNGPITGQRYEVTVRENRRRVFDRDSLPKAILHDDRFWMTRVSTRVVTCAHDDSAAAPAPRGAQLDLWGRETDLVLIEEI